MTTLIRFSKYAGDRGRHLGAKHIIISFPHQAPGDQSDSIHASKRNKTLHITQHSCNYWSMAYALFYPQWTVLGCVIIQGVLIGWNSCGERNDLPSEADISPYCKTWAFDRLHATEFIQVKAGPSLWKPAEPSWDPVQKSQKLNTKTKSYHKCHPRTTYSSFTFSPLVAAAVCTSQGSYFRATAECLWKGMREQKVSGHCKRKQNSRGGETTNESVGE